MTDIMTKEQRSRTMSHIHKKDTSIELKLRKALWHKGYHYRLNYKKLPGTPDIALTKYKIAIFVDGEFWHGKDFEKTKDKLKNNKDYWIEKIEENIQRDIKIDGLLRNMDWTPLHFWSNDVKKYLDFCISEIEDTIHEINMLDE